MARQLDERKGLALVALYRRSLARTTASVALVGSSLLLSAEAAADSPAAPYVSSQRQVNETGEPSGALKITKRGVGEYTITYTLSSGDKARLSQDTMIGPAVKITGSGGEKYLNSDRGYTYTTPGGVKFILHSDAVTAEKDKDKVRLDFPKQIIDPEGGGDLTPLVVGGAAIAGLSLIALRLHKITAASDIGPAA